MSNSKQNVSKKPAVRLDRTARAERQARPRPLDEELEETLVRREALSRVEELLMRGDFPEAASVLRQTRTKPVEGDARELLDTWLEVEPASPLMLEARARVYQDASRFTDAARDLVRAALVTEGRKPTIQLLDRLATLEKVQLAPWMEKAVASVGARLKGDSKAEKQLLLEAVRGAPDELALFAALARNQLGSCSDVELFALRQCVRCSPFWLEARAELRRAASAIGDPDAMRIEDRPRAPGSERRYAVYQDDVSLDDDDGQDSGRHRPAA
jgi:hypothetical protein